MVTVHTCGYVSTLGERETPPARCGLRAQHFIANASGDPKAYCQMHYQSIIGYWDSRVTIEQLAKKWRVIEESEYVILSVMRS